MHSVVWLGFSGTSPYCHALGRTHTSGSCKTHYSGLCFGARSSRRYRATWLNPARSRYTAVGYFDARVIAAFRSPSTTLRTIQYPATAHSLGNPGAISP